MIIGLTLLMAILLLILAFFLIAKQATFLGIIKDTPQHQSFLKAFGYCYLLLGVVGLPITYLNNKMATFGYLFVILVTTSIFSIRFSQKMPRLTK